MKTLLYTVLVLMSILGVEGKTVSVKGYYRKNGTYVRPHVRHTKGSSYSTGSSGRTYGGTGYVPSGNSVSIPRVSTDGTSVQHEQKVSLDTCRAIYDNGSRCCRWVESGKKYCASHMGYDPNNKPHYEEKTLPRNDSERVAATKEKLEKIRKAIDYYSDRREGSLPENIATLRAVNPTFMSPPTKDAWGKAFSCSLTEEGLDIRSAGPDAEFGTGDDLVLLMEK